MHQTAFERICAFAFYHRFILQIYTFKSYPQKQVDAVPDKTNPLRNCVVEHFSSLTVRVILWIHGTGRAALTEEVSNRLNGTFTILNRHKALGNQIRNRYHPTGSFSHASMTRLPASEGIQWGDGTASFDQSYGFVPKPCFSTNCPQNTEIKQFLYHINQPVFDTRFSMCSPAVCGKVRLQPADSHGFPSRTARYPSTSMLTVVVLVKYR